MAKLIGFSYLPYIQEDRKTGRKIIVYRPNAELRLSFSRGSLTNPFDALVDSGSDRNLFPIELGEIIGISFRKIKPTTIIGIGNYQIKAYPSKVNIWIGSSRYETEADFSPQQQTPLLGRFGFFNLFKSLKFSEKERFLYLEL